MPFSKDSTHVPANSYWGWDEKLLLLRSLLHKDSTSERNFIENLFPDPKTNEQGNTEADTFYTNQHKWKRASKRVSRPKRSSESIYFFSRILTELGLEKHPWDWFIETDVMDIAKALKKEQFNAIPTETFAQIDPASKVARPFHQHLQHLTYDVLGRRETVLQDGRFLDQQFCYLSAECVQRWRQLILIDEYQNFINCHKALRDCVVNKQWIEFVQSPNAARVVMLGGGGAEKSNTIIQSILRVRKDQKQVEAPLEFAIVDASALMCESDMRYLRQGDTLQRTALIDLRTYQIDFTNPSMLAAVAHPSQDRPRAATAFFIPGCTIANINEVKFMEALSSASRPGDVLVVGTEFIDEEDLATYKKDLLSRYDTHEMRDVVLYPMRQDLDKAAISNDVDTRREIVSIAIKDLNEINHLSGFTRGLTVEARINLERGRIKVDPKHQGLDDLVLMISKRFHYDDFLLFVERFGFSHRFSEEANYPNYKQVFFDRVENEGC